MSKAVPSSRIISKQLDTRRNSEDFEIEDIEEKPDTLRKNMQILGITTVISNDNFH